MAKRIAPVWTYEQFGCDFAGASSDELARSTYSHATRTNLSTPRRNFAIKSRLTNLLFLWQCACEEIWFLQCTIYTQYKLINSKTLQNLIIKKKKIIYILIKKKKECVEYKFFLIVRFSISFYSLQIIVLFLEKSIDFRIQNVKFTYTTHITIMSLRQQYTYIFCERSACAKVNSTRILTRLVRFVPRLFDKIDRDRIFSFLN